jgi:hypothetical protein
VDQDAAAVPDARFGCCFPCARAVSTALPKDITVDRDRLVHAQLTPASAPTSIST